MESNSLSLEQSLEQSFTKKEIDVQDLSKGVNVIGVPLVRLTRLIGFRKALSSKIVRWRYIVRLWTLREIYIMKVLLENYEKIPFGTPTKVFVAFVRLFKVSNWLLLPLEKRLLNNLIRNPYENKKTDNRKKFKDNNSNKE